MRTFGLTADEVNATFLKQAGFSRDNQTSICNPDNETTYFVEVCSHTYQNGCIC